MQKSIDGFGRYLREQEIDEAIVKASVSIIEAFSDFLEKLGGKLETASYADMYNFSDLLIENDKDTYNSYVALYRFGLFQKSNDLIIASMEVIDGGEMIENFYNRLDDEFGQEVRDEIFEGVGLPSMGLRPESKPEITKKLVNRFLAKFDAGTTKTFFEIGLRDKYTQSYVTPTQLYTETGDIDEFLKLRHGNLVARLQTHLEEGTLFFTQEINEDVVSYVKDRPTIGSGVRQGDRVIITKIPYMTQKFIEETDERMRRHYFCHNPWIRDALKKEDQPIDPVFCGCSAGYFKDFWEAVLGQPVRVEVLKSFINGDEMCEFALHLPPGVVGDR
ncbi:MAG: hypothetical protein ACXAEN_17655 [Candidatus Thorarchaeota archaeon]|jgi:hypothetical protein